MSKVYVRGGTWWASYVDALGRRLRRSTGVPVWTDEGADAELARAISEEQARAVLATLEAEGSAAGLTLSDYAATWLALLRRGGRRGWRYARSRLRRHILPRLGDRPLQSITAAQIRELVLQLTEEREIAPSSIRHAYFALASLFRSAAVEGLITATPCILRGDHLPRLADDAAWRDRAVFSAVEVQQLIGDRRIAEWRRVLWALLFLGGLRIGEAADLTWASYDPDRAPLGSLLVRSSWCTAELASGPTKTGAAREVPVHVWLAEVLERWRRSDDGYVRATGATPEPTDPIAPYLGRDGPCKWRSDTARKLFHRDLKRLGLRPRRVHDARRTFISLCRSGGASKDQLRFVTHGRKGDVLDDYSAFEWASRCDQVTKMKLQRSTNPQGGNQR